MDTINPEIAQSKSSDSSTELELKLREMMNIIIDTLEFHSCRMSTFKQRVKLEMHSQKWDSEKVSISEKSGQMIVEFFKLRAEYLSLEQRFKWECNS